MQIEIGDSVYEVPLPKFNIGEDVVNKKFGYPAVGKVVSIIFGHQYRKMLPEDTNFAPWDSAYPKWEDKYIYSVVFKEAMYPVTADEIAEISGYPADLIADTMDDFPKTHIIDYVEDDLEGF